ncbi:MAG: hypothetical protein NVS3B16_09200 [Vulcanimicrobiaceae bacterium]
MCLAGDIGGRTVDLSRSKDEAAVRDGLTHASPGPDMIHPDLLYERIIYA